MSKKRFKPKVPVSKTNSGGDSKKPSPVSKPAVFNVISIVVIALVILSAVLIIAVPDRTTTEVDADLKAAGMTAELTGELTQKGLSYQLGINRSEGMGLGGGLIGGLGGQEVGTFQNISEETTYIEGLDKFQENIGLLLNSYKDRYYTVSADTSGSGDLTKRTKVNISTHVDLIPFWPAGVDQDYRIVVEFADKGDAQRVIIEEVQVQIWRTLDNDGIHYTENRVLWNSKPNTELTSEGQKKSFSTSISLDEMEDVIGLLTYVKIKFIDRLGNDVDPNLVSNLAEPDPDKHEVPLALTINLRTLDSVETTQLGMLIISYPLSIISLIFSIMGFLVFLSAHFRPKFFRTAGYIILAAAIMQILAAGFLYLGVENLINLIDGVFKADLREGFTWTDTLMQLFIPGFLLLASGIIVLATHKRQKKVKKSDRKPKVDEPKEETFQLISD